jgi:hypothetical protein
VIDHTLQHSRWRHAPSTFVCRPTLYHRIMLHTPLGVGNATPCYNSTPCGVKKRYVIVGAGKVGEGIFNLIFLWFRPAPIPHLTVRRKNTFPVNGNILCLCHPYLHLQSHAFFLLRGELSWSRVLRSLHQEAYIT